jgi:glutamate synthase domain-containing protein 1
LTLGRAFQPARAERTIALRRPPPNSPTSAQRRRPTGSFIPTAEPALAVPFGIFHQRFSTNTTPSWERAQPFRFLCHNGEINAIRGNVNWMRAREGNLGSADDELLHPVVDEAGSDSSMLDNVLELLVRGGRDIRHALAMLIPEAWEGNVELDSDGATYYHGALRTVGRAEAVVSGRSVVGAGRPQRLVHAPRSGAGSVAPRGGA